MSEHGYGTLIVLILNWSQTIPAKQKAPHAQSRFQCCDMSYINFNMNSKINLVTACGNCTLLVPKVCSFQKFVRPGVKGRIRHIYLDDELRILKGSGGKTHLLLDGCHSPVVTF